jgi:HopA1 effector protein family
MSTFSSRCGLIGGIKIVMQELLDSWQKQPLDSGTTPLQRVLDDIVHYIQIQPNFWIGHSLHPPLELRAEVFNGLRLLPIDLQDQYLRLRLGSYIYNFYDTSGEKNRIEPNADSEHATHQESSAQNMAQGVHSSFYKSLHVNNSGQGYFDPGWLVLKEASDGLLAVQKDGLTLHVSRDRHLSPTEQAVATGERVAVHLPRNRIESGCYVAVGDQGPVQSSEVEHCQMVDVYFNLGAENIVAVMRDLTTALNGLNLPFTFKVPYAAEDCDRNDTGILNFDKRHYPEIQPVLAKIYQTHQSAFRPEVPLFSKQLAPGLALAEDPLNRFTPQESFSINRCQTIADGLLKAWREGQESPEARMNAILESFAAHCIDLNHSYLNPESMDCYAPIMDSANAMAF